MDMILLSEDLTIFKRTKDILMIMMMKREKIFSAKINDNIQHLQFFILHKRLPN